MIRAQNAKFMYSVTNVTTTEKKEINVILVDKIIVLNHRVKPLVKLHIGYVL